MQMINKNVIVLMLLSGITFRFFTENPSYQQNFKSFKDVPIDQLRGNKKVLAHSNNVLYQISMLVDYLDDTETLVEMLIKTAKNHYRRKITIEMFQNLEHTLVGLLKEKLGGQLMNDFAMNAWKKTYGVILQVVQKGFDEAAKDSS